MGDGVIDDYDGYLFDLDGVITATSVLHQRAWQETFEPLFASTGVEPYRESDYYESLDGKSRFEGVASLLATRELAFPHGAPDDDGTESTPTVMGLGNLKNRKFMHLLETD